MTNVRAQAAYQHATAAFRNPTLDLLHGRYAPFVVASLSLLFSADRTAVAVADAHVEVAEIIDELRTAGYDDLDPGLPAGSGREICRYWVRVGWLVPQIEDTVEVYRLSAQAVGALEIAGRAGGGRVSRSRVRTLLDSVDQLALSAETDPDRRLARLVAQRTEIDAEIERLHAGEIDETDDELLLEEAENVLHLARELPADFSRVAESINAMQRDVVADLRRDVRPPGEVLREYLHRGQHVMQATPEGRAFAGALRLIGDPEHIESLTDQVHTLLARPFARLLNGAQREELSAIAKRVEQGVQEVLTAQRRASHVITAQVRTHDPARDREVDDLLRGVMSGLQSWMQVSRPTDRVTPLGHFPTAHIRHLRQTLSDPRPPQAPAPLVHADDVLNPQSALGTDSREWGGPHYRELEAHVATLGDDFDLGDAFTTSDTRRPVDLLGLLEIVHGNGMTERDEITVVTAERPDGTTRKFAFVGVQATASPDEHSGAPVTGAAAPEIVIPHPTKDASDA
ncbi:hypothetical protein JOF28_000651 [Leucobacter exalbidus]|uniref:DUF3375 domain-containing protein n=1 Tax=Leucobacter exalbidus TaxID=662960 RepID=A0A940PUA7_9MICO|nr:DUF3375 domain-containing protein [Leucobacter exalbidus]MBP1325419.1 hypothetical protein [Leucobacter exalbidus]